MFFSKFLESSVEKSKKSRIGKRSSRAEANHHVYQYSDVKEYYRREYFEVLDVVLAALAERFQDNLPLLFLTIWNNYY